jgi:acetyl-CoA/propionyl-CoA carboxylase biotin carboxyl carrier protein
MAFRSVLVANRGEIAARILRTVRAQGMRGVLVHHQADRGAPGLALADECIEITGGTPVAAYLDIDQIIAAAKKTRAEAIHPGYGFLSENVKFARATAEADLVFIGPSTDAIELMGDKVRARSFVAERGFRVAPSAIEDDDPKTFIERARAVGAPLLIKPSAGGGGKGMRIVRDLDRLEEDVARAKSEGQRYFGDGRVYAERYIERPRHIEVQVLGDTHGNVVHLFERECSLQRRFQKIIEEAPSPALTPKLRAKICETAIGIAAAANYTNAGTIEFIYGNGEFYFLEMNTRLQVEHPVTEMITGKDLVAEQLRIAAGEPLGYSQDDIKRRGHAIEMRIYAEDPARDFSPTTGRVLRLATPDDARCDLGIAEGQAITAAFDPMLAKLIVHADTREAALEQADIALAKFALLGCRTNKDFLRRLLADTDVAAGAMHTGLIGEKPELLTSPEPTTETARALLAAASLSLPPVLESAHAAPTLHAAIGGWRN